MSIRKLLVAVVVIGSFGPVASAAAGPPVKIPKNCHEWNELLGIQNVRSCDDPGS